MKYDIIRNSLFKGKISESQFAGMEAVLQECAKQGVTDRRQIAYIFGTIYHEVRRTMQPIEEDGRGKSRTYGHKVWRTGKVYNDVDHIYFGRGLVQVTWRDNYVMLTKAAKKAGYDWDFENNPELLLQTAPSTWAAVYGMRTGSFTGVGLSRYFNDKTIDFINARKIINGKDCAELIAEYSKSFFVAFN